jgi:hypothetical protein
MNDARKGYGAAFFTRASGHRSCSFTLEKAP